jgi:F-type H+-transporting ATPase subunit b
MQIDWFTFGAQIANFLILVWLLRRFLYGPITSAMAEREQRIADQFEEAREKQEEAEAQIAEYRQKREELAAAREERLAEAEAAARERRQEMIEEARAEVERIEEQWTDALRRERADFLQDLTRRTSQEMLELIRRALRDLADADLERRLVRVFLDHLRDLEASRAEALSGAVRTHPDDVLVRTAFDLDEEQRRALTDTLRAVTDTEAEPSFEREAALGLGVEIRAGGHKIAWNLDSYVAQLEERVRSQLDAEIGADAPSTSAEAPESLAAVPTPSSDESQSS